MNLVEKYRPTDFSNYVGQEKIVNVVKKMIESNEIIDMIFYGSFGIGKTSLAYVIGRKITVYPVDFVHLNASDINKKEDIQYYVLELSRIKTSGKYRLIVLDEAEQLTKKAQECLKTFLETKNEKIKVIFIVNDFGKIIEAIKSRCLCLRFEKLKVEVIKEHLKYINKEEEIGFEDSDIEKIAISSGGDLRNAIKMLQSDVDSNSKIIDFDGFFSLVSQKKTKDSYKFLLDIIENNPIDLVLDVLFEYCFAKEIKDEVFIYIADIERSLKNGFSIYISIMEFCVKIKKLM